MDQPETGKRQPAINAPGIVIAGIVSFVAVHLYRNWLDYDALVNFLLTYAFFPARYGGGADLTGISFPGGIAGDTWTFVTYVFIHADWSHLIVNSIWMLAFGSAVARRMPAGSFVVFSLLCGGLGATATLFYHWGELVPVVGASAAVSGQMAGAVRLIYAEPSSPFSMTADMTTRRPATIPELFRNPRALLFLGIWAVINYVFGVGAVLIGPEAGTIAWEAHLGGFAAGLFLFGLFDRHGGNAERSEETY